MKKGKSLILMVGAILACFTLALEVSATELTQGYGSELVAVVEAPLVINGDSVASQAIAVQKYETVSCVALLEKTLPSDSTALIDKVATPETVLTNGLRNTAAVNLALQRKQSLAKSDDALSVLALSATS